MKKPMKFLAFLLASALAAVAFTACTTPTSVTLSQDYAEVFVGATFQLQATVTSDDVVQVSWSSSDETVARVDENGNVEALSQGSATITATADGASDECFVLVGALVEAGSLTIDRESLIMDVGRRFVLRATVTPVTASVLWISSDSSVVQVTTDGSLTALNAGTAVITAISGTFSDTCTVLVRAAEGSDCPDFEVPVYDNVTGELTDKTYSPADSRGKVTVINFWGTWCPPCKDELPFFDRVAREDEDVVVVAVHSVQDMAGAPSHIAENYPDSAIIFAQDSALSGAGTDDVITMMGGGMQYPYTVIVNAEGEITYLGAGSMTYEQLAALVAEAKA